MTITSEKRQQSARITSRRDWLPPTLWAVAAALAIGAALVRPGALPGAAGATLRPFAELAAIIAASALAGRLGLFAVLARWIVRDGAPPAAAAASVLALTALLAGLVNLDVAVVVAVPVALTAAPRHGLAAGRLALAAALTANASSFLLPTANITTLLLLSRVPLSAAGYLASVWPAWLLVVALTIGALTLWLARGAPGGGALPGPLPGRPGGGPSGRALADLIPMFVSAASIRALLTAGITLRVSLAGQLALSSVLAGLLNNLPAAALLHPAGTAGLWAAVLATAIGGPGLLVTGSVATVISRRLARDAGAPFRSLRYSAVGAILVPFQLAVAVAGLFLAGALH